MDIQRINLHTSAFNEITHLYFIKNIKLLCCEICKTINAYG